MNAFSKISRFYLFHGEDEYTKMKKVKDLINSVIQKGFEDFDYHYFESRGLDMPTLINAASSPPFGSPIRVVLLRNVDKVSPKGQTLLMKFIESIPEYTTLVLTSGKLEPKDKKKKIFKALLAHKKDCIEFAEPTPEKALILLEQTAKDLQIDITREALEYLVETIGCKVGILEQEINKLAIYAGNDTVIGEGDVAQLIGAGTMGTVVDLPVKIARGEIADAIKLLHHLQLTKQGEGTILFRIKDFFLKLNMAKTTNVPSYILAKNFRLLKKTSDALVQIAPRLSFSCLINCLHYIYESEISLKSAGLKKNIILIDLVSRLGVEVNRE
ncbi:MAG: DNA polymerase III subunit delta [candidate division Zixibacteria bacterium]|nr:DNA polymerase III subunit delta [candidate division Zixibacteria bacterium]